jgi:hypothetical protein
MLQFFRHTILWVIALSILNTSIDIPENPFASFASSAQDEAYDEIESIAEFVLDETLDQTLPDQTGNDDQGILKKAPAFDFSLPEKKERQIGQHFLTNGIKLTGKQDQNDLPDGFTSLFTQPPDLA